MSLVDRSGRPGSRPDGERNSRTRPLPPEPDYLRHEASAAWAGIEVVGSPDGSAGFLTAPGRGGGSGGGCAEVVVWEAWRTREDERVCPECGPLDGRWFEAGSGPQPPLHSHCRCWREVVSVECVSRPAPRPAPPPGGG